jgi:YVTN family beta-propeller protein
VAATIVEPGAVFADVAISPNGAFVYATSYFEDRIYVINTAINSLATIITAPFPYGIAITPDGASAYVGDFSSANVSVVDLATNTLTTAVGPMAEFAIDLAMKRSAGHLS